VRTASTKQSFRTLSAFRRWLRGVNEKTRQQDAGQQMLFLSYDPAAWQLWSCVGDAATTPNWSLTKRTLGWWAELFIEKLEILRRFQA